MVAATPLSKLRRAGRAVVAAKRILRRGALPAQGEQCRRAVAIANARLSVHNYHRGLRVAHALGLPAAVPREVDAALREVETVLRAPSPLMQAIAESPWGALLPNAKALVHGPLPR